MSFLSYSYALLLLVAALAFRLAPQRWRAHVAVGASAIFYASWDLSLCLLILVLAPRLAFDQASGKLNDMRLRELAEQVVGKERSFEWTAGLEAINLAPLYADSAHHTPIGNERVGQQLAQWWQRQGLCP